MLKKSRFTRNKIWLKLKDMSARGRSRRVTILNFQHLDKLVSHIRDIFSANRWFLSQDSGKPKRKFPLDTPTRLKISPTGVHLDFIGWQRINHPDLGGFLKSLTGVSLCLILRSEWSRLLINFQTFRAGKTIIISNTYFRN